jgi:hypothetical protein
MARMSTPKQHALKLAVEVHLDRARTRALGTHGGESTTSSRAPAGAERDSARGRTCPPALLQILTGQAGKSSETMQPERAAGHEVHEF